MAEESTNESGKKKTSGNFTDPCLLIDYIQEFALKSRTEYNPNGWRNFKTVDVTSAASTPSDIISSMTSRGGIREFLNMDNTTLGLLVPKVRLYKQYYQSIDDTVGKSVEYVFDDSLNADNIAAMTASPDRRSGGAGIQEVSWEFNGTNPAEAERVITVSMKLVFQSAYDLLGNRYDPAEGNILAIDPEEDFLAEDGIQYTRNYVDLILHPPSKTEAFGGRAREDEVGNKYVPKFYRLKMVVGWAIPEGQFPNLLNEPNETYRDGEAPKSKTEKLKEELRSMELSIFLNLVSHQLNIRENGQIELSIDYIGSFEETINGNAANVLTAGDPQDSRLQDLASEEQFYDNKRNFIEGSRKVIQEAQKQLDCIDTSTEQGREKAKELEEKIKEHSESIKKETEKVEEFDNNSKSIIYQQFLARLNQKVKTFSLNATQAKDWTDSLDTNIRPKFDNIVGNVLSNEANLNASLEAQTMLLSETVVAGTDLSGDQEKELEKAIKTSKKALEDKDVNFIYFGDILDLACELANSNVNNQVDSVMKILTGPVMITHPRIAGLNGKKILMNLADIPISYDDFQLFFFETVVRKELASYPLRTFIKDVLERLVKKVLQPRECFAKGREQRQVDIGMTNFTVRSSVAKQMGLDSNTSSSRFQLDISEFINQNPEGSDPDSDYNCMLLYMTSYASFDLEADEEEDRKKGIYHYFIGAERGLIQKIEFSRSDVQGLREARQAESRNLGQIRDVYNANVRMVGNTLYIPGMKVFLNPPIGFGRPEAGTKKPDEASGKPGMYGSLANLLGIGGYYDVIKVQSTISNNSVFTTELDCVFAQSGAYTDKIQSMCKELLEEMGLPNNISEETGE